MRLETLLYNPFSVKAQQARIQLVRSIRTFFEVRGVLEVDTPLLGQAPVTDPHLSAIEANCLSKTFYLQTSPEYAMKRLLAEGSGSIYQICKAFRNEEVGQWHRPEFTLLEWYRVGFTDQELMQEVADLLNEVAGLGPAYFRTYQSLFEEYVGWNPHTVEEVVAIEHAKAHIGEVSGIVWTKDVALQFLMTEIIEPRLKNYQVLFITDYPASQAALAKTIVKEGFIVAQRFEVYVDGVELANGYHELTDPNEQAQRFEKDLQHRQQLGLPLVPIDKELLLALEKGLPECAGVALGLDRFLNLKLSNGGDVNVINPFN